MDLTVFATTVGGSFLAGMLIGYFLRVSMKLLMFILGAFTFTLYVLYINNVIDVNWEALGDILAKLLHEADKHVTMVTSLSLPFVLGMMVGWRLGARRVARGISPPRYA